MLTTITVNGTEGLRFLANLQEHSRTGVRAVPPALAAMIEHLTRASSTEDLETVRLEVAAPLAEEIAAFVETVSQGQGTPLLFSAQLGDVVVLVRDVLAEMHVTKREGRMWRFLPAGTVGRLTARKGDLGKLLLIDGPMSSFPAREHAFVSDRCTTRTKLPRV
ncbi:MAG: hypothetical protein H0V17_33145 [Deltaproteobacteria bacterium]|nr:hypothetical protein [Deltaproteobacteria bacterium]